MTQYILGGSIYRNTTLIEIVFTEYIGKFY